MHVSLRFGKQQLQVALPAHVDATVLRKPSMPQLDQPQAHVQAAIAKPVGCAPLAELAQGAKSACIAICDITRPVPNHLFLRPLIETLEGAGIARHQIQILIATGLHRPNLGEELAELIGDDWVQGRVAIANHDARDDAAHVTLGATPTRGTRVRLDRRFVEADVRIVTGLVEPHFMAGYSGGRKVIAPGLAHAETITTFHSARFMADPAAINCNFAGNPLHEEQLAIVDLLGNVYAVNTVIDEDRQLSFVNFGDVLASHEQAVDFVRPYCELPVKGQFPTVLTSAAGYPLDKTYYQTVKGMVAAMDILQPGGDLFIVSECGEGLGSPEFVAAQERLVELGPHAFLESLLAKSHADIDEWQSQMQTKPMALGRVHLYSPSLSPKDREKTGVHCVDDLEAALAESLQRHATNAIAVIPEGPYVVPRLEADVATS